IFEDIGDAIASESVGLRKYVSLSLVYVNNSAAGSSNPHTAVAIAEDPASLEVPHRGGQCIRDLDFPANEPPYSPGHADQKLAVLPRHQVLEAVRLARHKMEFRWSRPPAPHPVIYSGPELAVAIGLHRPNSMAAEAWIASDGAHSNF